MQKENGAASRECKKCTTWKRCNTKNMSTPHKFTMKNVHDEKATIWKEIKYENRVTWKKCYIRQCNTEKVQHKTTRKTWNMKKMLQRILKKGATWKECNAKKGEKRKRWKKHKTEKV